VRVLCRQGQLHLYRLWDACGSLRLALRWDREDPEVHALRYRRDERPEETRMPGAHLSSLKQWRQELRAQLEALPGPRSRLELSLPVQRLKVGLESGCLREAEPKGAPLESSLAMNPTVANLLAHPREVDSQVYPTTRVPL